MADCADRVIKTPRQGRCFLYHSCQRISLSRLDTAASPFQRNTSGAVSASVIGRNSTGGTSKSLLTTGNTEGAVIELPHPAVVNTIAHSTHLDTVTINHLSDCDGLLTVL